MNLVWTAASLVGTRCFAVYNNSQAQKSQMQQDMSLQLFDKMQDSQEGVVGGSCGVQSQRACGFRVGCVNVCLCGWVGGGVVSGQSEAAGYKAARL